MHTYSIAQVLVTGLMAASAVNGYRSAGPRDLAPRHVVRERTPTVMFLAAAVEPSKTVYDFS